MEVNGVLEATAVLGMINDIVLDGIVVFGVVTVLTSAGCLAWWRGEWSVEYVPPCQRCGQPREWQHKCDDVRVAGSGDVHKDVHKLETTFKRRNST
jgi:hypothetical protein